MDISQIFDDIKNSSKETLVDKFDFVELHKLNTDDGGGKLEPQISIFLEWSRSFLKRIPSNWKDYLPAAPSDLVSIIDGTIKLLDRISATSKETATGRGAKMSGLVMPSQQQMGRTVNSIKELIFIQMIGDDRSSENASIIEKSKRVQQELEEIVARSANQTDLLTEMVTASQESTAKIAASGRARVFHIEAIKYQDTSRRWLALTGVFGACLILLATGFAFGWVLPIPQGSDASQIASLLFGKVLILITVGASVTFAAKQYAANRHNAIQNFHRSSALRTYRALLAASRDEAVHDAILNQAAQAIFSPSETGYSKMAPTYDSSPVVQLINGIGRSHQNPTP